MRLVLDEICDLELKKYLLTQDGIKGVEIIPKDFISEFTIDFDNTISILTIFKFIELFQNNEYSTLLAFDKDINLKLKEVEYTIDDICCEYCYKGLIKDLFLNDKIKAVKSNFDFNNPTDNIELVVELYEGYTKDNLINYIKAKIG